MRKSWATTDFVLKLAGACAPLAVLALAGAAHAQGAVPVALTDAGKTFNHLVGTTCVKCHNADDWAGGLAMDTLDLSQVGDDPEVWEKAINKLRGRLMPPAGATQPTQADIDATIALSRDVRRRRREGPAYRPRAHPAPQPHRIRNLGEAN